MLKILHTGYPDISQVILALCTLEMCTTDKYCEQNTITLYFKVSRSSMLMVLKSSSLVLLMKSSMSVFATVLCYMSQ